MKPRRFASFAWVTLAWTIIVVLWGAWVRISFSGDGCGANWPLCNGAAIPKNMSVATAIEYTHRMTTTVDVLLMVGMCVLAFLWFPKRHAVRKFAVWAVVFLFIEALLGAGLVKFRLVAHDQSAGRAWYLCAHLVNTLLLLGAVYAAGWAAKTNRSECRIFSICSRRLAALAIIMFVSVTGALAALGDTLFPASSVASGLKQDFLSGSAALLRLRMLHPLLAVCGAAYLLWTLLRTRSESGANAGQWAMTLTVLQVAAGLSNIVLLAPVWMQIVHLCIADLLWIAALGWALPSAICLPQPNQLQSGQSQLCGQP